MNKTKVIFLACLFFLTACSKSNDSEVVQSPVAEKAEVGPFTVAFSGDNQSYEHNFKININQDEGKVEYFVQTAEAAKIDFIDTKLTVSGCPAAQVIHRTFWIPDASTQEGELTMPGFFFETIANKKGVLLHVLKGLNGCSSVELKTVLKKQKPPTLR